MIKSKYFVALAVSAALMLAGCGDRSETSSDSAAQSGSVSAAAGDTGRTTVSDRSAESGEGADAVLSDSSSSAGMSVSEDAEPFRGTLVTVSAGNSWPDGENTAYQYSASLMNRTGTALSTWKFEIDTEGGDSRQNISISDYWNCVAEADGGKVSFTPADYNAEVEDGGTVSDIGMICSAAYDPCIEGTYAADADSGMTRKLTDDERIAVYESIGTAGAADSDGEAGSVQDNGAGSDKGSGSDVGSETETGKDSGGKKTGGRSAGGKAGTMKNTENGKTPLSVHGALSVKGTDLVDENGDKYQLKGVSTHGIAWFPQYVNEDAFRTLRDDWGANLVRLAMYTDESGGYCTDGDKEELESVVERGVDAATDLGMYVIIDWHILHDETPLKYEDQAEAFFEKMSSRYADNKNVLYEICNEPNGSTTWSDVKKYAEDIIPIIRKNAPDAVILVGSPTWSQDVDKAAADPISGYDNIMYTLHFYAATHKDDLRNKMVNAIKSGLPVFISEFSICDASGNGGVDYDSANAWAKLIREYNLSYAGWSLSNKNETSAILNPDVTSTGGGWTDSDLSETGLWLRNLISS